MTKVFKGFLVVVTSLAALVAFGQPAHAVTDIYVETSIVRDGEVVVWDYHVHLPSNQWDAQGYINNGATIKVSCWAYHTGRRIITRTHSGMSSQPVYAAQDGVRLDGSYPVAAGGPFNTSGDARRDAVYCGAVWTDGDGAKLPSLADVIVGFF